MMEKEKLEKYAGYIGRYAGYTGLGLLGGFISFLLGLEPFWRMSGRGLVVGIFVYIVYGGPIIILISILGGCLGGVIAKKLWGALVGGFVLSGLAIFLYIS